MKVIKLRLVGGLGNQLFQFTFALAVKEKFDFQAIEIDISDMANYKENWGFLLYEILDEDKLSKIIRIKKSRLLKLRLARILSYTRTFGQKLGLISDRNGYDILNMNKKVKNNNLYIDGYFEYKDKLELYLKTIKPYLRSDLLIPISDSVLVVNVRGGEFLNIGRSSFEDKKNYSELISKALANIKNPQIHVVSDDNPFAKQLLEDICSVDVYHEPSPFDNFRTIYSAKHKIIARSTFSKWAGYLSSDFSKIYWLEQNGIR
jgi:hypothetical protein